MLRTVRKCYFPLLLLLMLASCGPASDSNSEVESRSNQDEQTAESAANRAGRSDDAKDGIDKAPTSDAEKVENKPMPDPIYPVLEPGRYCYTSDTDFETIYARLSVDSADRVTGDVQGTIHNEENSYYTSYTQAVDGTIDGSNLNVDVATWIEYDRQNRQEVWRVSDDALKIDSATLEKEKCAAVNKAFQNEDGLEAADLTQSANRVKTTPVFFESGKRDATVSDAVVRGDRDVYLVGAQGGQKMTLSISALENNAVFDVVSPSNMILGTELKQTEIFLPHTGDYKIIVGGTRGNATYDLKIEVE